MLSASLAGILVLSKAWAQLLPDKAPQTWGGGEEITQASSAGGCASALGGERGVIVALPVPFWGDFTGICSDPAGH